MESTSTTFDVGATTRPRLLGSGTSRKCAELTGTAEIGGSVKKAENLVRFGTVGVSDGPQVDCPMKDWALNSL